MFTAFTKESNLLKHMQARMESCFQRECEECEGLVKVKTEGDVPSLSSQQDEHLDFKLEMQDVKSDYILKQGSCGSQYDKNPSHLRPDLATRRFMHVFASVCLKRERKSSRAHTPTL